MTTMLSGLDGKMPAASFQADLRHPEYQNLKGRVHQDLLNRLHLDRLSQIRREDAEPEIRGLIAGMLEIEARTTPLTQFERDTLTVEVLDEIFGLGPLEPLLTDPAISDILVNRFDKVYIEREGRLEKTSLAFRNDAHVMQI